MCFFKISIYIEREMCVYMYAMYIPRLSVNIIFVIHKQIVLHIMMPFSTRTGLERIGIVGPESELSLGWSAGFGCWIPLQKQEIKRIGGGSPVASPMAKSVLP